jgi:hypothetical protein
MNAVSADEKNAERLTSIATINNSIMDISSTILV